MVKHLETRIYYQWWYHAWIKSSRHHHAWYWLLSLKNALLFQIQMFIGKQFTLQACQFFQREDIDYTLQIRKVTGGTIDAPDCIQKILPLKNCNISQIVLYFSCEKYCISYFPVHQGWRQVGRVLHPIYITCVMWKYKVWCTPYRVPHTLLVLLMGRCVSTMFDTEHTYG